MITEKNYIKADKVEQIHGTHIIKVNNRIIFSKISGACNEYNILEFAKKVEEIVNDFNGDSFCLLVDFTDIIGGTPEAFNEANKFNEWLNTQNMIAKAIVATSQSFLVVNDSRIIAQESQDYKNFYNLEDAQKWLESKIKEAK